MPFSIKPYDAPGRRAGEDAYDFDGIQMLVKVVDRWSSHQVRYSTRRAIEWTRENYCSCKAEEKVKRIVGFQNGILALKRTGVGTP